MSMTLSSSTFAAVILFIVISDYCLQATQNEEGKKRRRELTTAAKNGASTSGGSTNCDEWNLDSVIQIEMNGEPLCVASLLDKTGCSTFSPIITVDGTLQTGIAAPMDCLEKIKANAGQFKVKTADGTLIPFAYNDEGLLKTLLESTKVKLIPHVRKQLSKGTKGMATIWKDGKVTLKEFVIVDHHNCDIEKVDNLVCFCAENAGKEKINAGKGAPFFLKLDGRQFAMGVQLEYSKTTGGNTYGLIPVGTLVKVPASELALTSSGVFDFDSVIKVEQNGRHLCLTGAFFNPDGIISVVFPMECDEEMKKNIGGVKYKTVGGEEFPIQVSDDNGRLKYYMPRPYNGKLSLKLNARLPIGTKGMAATWDKGNVVWKEFIVDYISDCGADALPIALKNRISSLDNIFCIKQVGGENLNAGLGSPFYIKVRASQYLVGVQVAYVASTGGNFYVTGAV